MWGDLWFRSLVPWYWGLKRSYNHICQQPLPLRTSRLDFNWTSSLGWWSSTHHHVSATKLLACASDLQQIPQRPLGLTLAVSISSPSTMPATSVLSWIFSTQPPSLLYLILGSNRNSRFPRITNLYYLFLDTKAAISCHKSQQASTASFQFFFALI